MIVDHARSYKFKWPDLGRAAVVGIAWALMVFFYIIFVDSDSFVGLSSSEWG